ncbi:DNA-binding response regulator [Glutamicibacter uratoxydans]|uniref:DNA-binding response regulator n=1 Tax=Glutamicibacter uratoxydans TaxID=43667 RepID=A0A4Y4DLW7_GLUUR|nr:response regulator transcription factor [Glutamicibacter uratoxydans]GED06322.1 DNA-binding response regulator [Glutamicibacter uratoxydans]
MEQVKVLIVDDEPLIRNALGTILATDAQIVTLDSVENGLKAVEFCQNHEVDVILMDLQMPIMDGVTATREIKSIKNSPAILAITAFSSDDYLVPVLAAGASGYLVKDTDPAEIISAVHAVHRGTAAISASVSSELVSAIQVAYRDTTQEVEDLISDLGLTAREVEILNLLAKGLNNPEISKLLKISETTVKTHMAKIFSKLEVRDRVQALVAATRMGLIEIPRDS